MVRFACLAGLLGLSGLALAQIASAPAVAVRGAHIERDGAIMHARDNAEVISGTWRVRANLIDFHSDTGEANARGDVRADLGSAPLKLEAVRQWTEGSIVHLRGHAVIRSGRDTLRANEIDLHKDTGVAEARGDVKVEFGKTR